MKTLEIKGLLQLYFDGETTLEQEEQLIKYFTTDEVAAELKKYQGFFAGVSELSSENMSHAELNIEADIIDFINRNETGSKNNTRTLWQIVSGVAATVILVMGGWLLYQQQEMNYTDTYDNPEVAYAVAEQALNYVSVKYNKGLAAMNHFDKLQTAAEPLQQGIKPVNEYLELIENMGNMSNTE